MHFPEAERRYRELEDQLLRGQLSEEDFLEEVAELRVLDEAGHRWRLSGRTGRWLVHDGRQWVAAQPPTEAVEPLIRVRALVEEKAEAESEPVAATIPPPTTVPEPSSPDAKAGRSSLPQLLALALALLLVVVCAAGAGVVGWVFFLRDLGEPAYVPTSLPAVSIVQTYTPRPVTATYTPTFTPTPSRTPTPTDTPIATDTSIPTDTPVATDTAVSTDTPTPRPTSTRATATPTSTSGPTTASPQAEPTEAPTATAEATTVPAPTYTIKAGDTLYAIATSFGVTTQALSEANGITNPRLLRVGQVLVIPVPGTTVLRTTAAATTAAVTAVAAAPGPQTYTIRAGDTLNEIAAQFGVSAAALAEANDITDAALIRSGQVLVIPVQGAIATGAPTTGTTAATTAGAVASTPQTYTIKAGDTLNEIAARFGVNAEALAEANDITNAALIRSGQILVIPIGSTAVAIASSGPTPTWTPIVLRTPTTATTSRVTPTSVAAAGTGTPTPSPTRSGPTSTPRPTSTPMPAATPTARPVALSGKIAFTVWNPPIGKYELYISNIDGAGRNLLGQGFRQPQFRQDGNLLAVNGDGAPDYEHLVTMNPSGGEKRGVSQHSEDSFPTWSPDGAIVAFSSTSWGDGRVRLGIVHDMFGPAQNWIPMGNSQIEGRYPFWMADGRIVYRGCDLLSGGGSCGLYWVGSDGGGYHRITSHESDTAPAGSGSQVAFMSAVDGNWEVYTVDINGGSPRRLTNNPANDGLPTWSPDGKSIAFVSNRDAAWAIWAMGADGSNQRKLFDLGGGYGGGEYDWSSERISWAP